MQIIYTTNKVSVGIGFHSRNTGRVRWLFIGWRGLTFIGWDWVPTGFYGVKYRPDQVID